MESWYLILAAMNIKEMEKSFIKRLVAANNSTTAKSGDLNKLPKTFLSCPFYYDF